MLALGSVPIAFAVGGLTLAQLFVVALASGILTVFFDVAYQSYLPALVGREHLVEGNAKLTGSAQVAAVAGPSVAGGLVQAIGSSAAVAVDSASFLVSAAALVAIRAPEPKPVVPEGGHPRLVHDIAEGLRFVFRNTLLRAIAATTATSNFFGGIAAAVEIVFLVRAVHASPGVIGLLFSMGGVGGVLGALAAGPIARRVGGARATLIGIAGNVGGLLIPLTMPGAGLALFGVGFMIVSFFVVVYNVNQVSFRQRLCPDRLLGRMNATHAVRGVGRAAHRCSDRRGPRVARRPAPDPVDRCRGRGARGRVAARVADAHDARLPRGARAHAVGTGRADASRVERRGRAQPPGLERSTAGSSPISCLLIETEIPPSSMRVTLPTGMATSLRPHR